MSTLGDFISEENLPQEPSTPVAESLAKQYDDIIVAEGATRFYFFDAGTQQMLPLADMSFDTVADLAYAFGAYLDRYHPT